MRIKKKLALPLLAALAFLALFLLTGCVSRMFVVTLAGGENAGFQARTEYVAENSEFTLPSMDEPWEGHVFTGWKNDAAVYAAGDKVKVTSDMTFTAVWEDEAAMYTITFIYGLNGEKSEVFTLKEGTMPTAPDIPDEISPDNSVNRIAGWKPAIVTVSADATYTALYEKAEITATFMDGDAVLKEQTLKSGETPTPPEVKDKDFAPSHTMVFKGWDKEVGAIVGDTVYRAVFEKRITTYEISFVYGSEGEHTQRATLDYGATPTAPTVEDEDFAPSHTMVFTGWDREITAVSADAVYTAQYEKRMMTYEITFVYGLAGEQQTKVTTEYGKKPVPPEIGNITAEDGTEHRFTGWKPVISAVTGETTYTAQYTREGAIATFKDGDEVLKTQIVKSGETPAPPAVADKDFAPSHTMVFKGWDKEVVGITEDTVYTAVFEKRMMRYEITFVYGSEGEKSEKATLDYGAAPVAPTVNDEVFAPSHTMVFKGWNREITAVSADATYTALYEKQITQYRITFVYGSKGEHTQNFTLDYGATPTAPRVENEDFAPSHTMVFTGWDREITAVSADAVYTAQYEKRMTSYLITFVYGIDGEYSEEFTLEYGQTPEPPAVPDVIMSKTLVNVFDGWDTAVVPVGGTAVYTAKYLETAREYTLRFADSAYVDFYDEAGANRISSLTGTYGQEMRFTVQKKAGAYILDMNILLGEHALTAESGVYSAALTADGLIVREQGARWVRFDVDVSSKNATYLPFETQNLNYGTVLKVYAKGNAWYEDDAPLLTYGGEAIASDGKETKDGAQYFTYGVFIDKNAPIKIEGVLDVVPVTYVDIFGEEHIVDWTIENYTVGSNEQFDPMGNYDYEGKYLYCGYKYDSSWSYSIFAYTASADLSARILDEDAYSAYIGEQVNTILLPQKGAENLYYIVYYEDVKTFQAGFTLPYDATEVQYLKDDETAWNTLTYVKEGDQNIAPYYEISSSFASGTVLYLRFTMPAGKELPALYHTATDGQIIAQEYALAGGTVLCYRIEVRDADAFYAAKFENTHTVSFNVDERFGEQFSVYNLKGNRPNYDGVTVQHNGVYSFKISYNKDKSTILQNITVNGEVFTFKDGFVPIKITGNAEYKVDSYIKWGSYYADFYLTNITSDLVIEINCEKQPASEMAFTISDDYQIYVDGSLLKGEVGSIATAPVSYDSTVEFRIVKEGYQFAVNGRFIYYYLLDGKSTEKAVYGGSLTEQNTVFTYVFSSFGFITPFDTSKPTYVESEIVPFRVNAEHDLSRSEATEANGVYFSGSAPTWANKDGAFTFTVTVPYGKVPKLYIQYSDALSDGFLPYEYELVREEGANNVYTFTVSPIPCDILWYIGLEADIFDITFVYGETQTTLQLPYGADLAKIDEIPKEFEGIKDGVPGFFRILGWSSTEGGLEDTLLAEKNGTLWAVTEFTAAAAVFEGVYYLDLNDAFAALNENSKGTLDLVYSKTNAPALQAGTYNLPAGVTMRLPYAAGAYGRTLAETTDDPSLFYADASRGTVALILGEGVTLNVYGTLSVGGIVGYKQSARPYQGQTSADYAILRLDGALNVQSGGVLDVNGYIVGGGKTDVLAGGASKLPFIVKDYKGGSNSQNVYNAGFVPLNIYEMPNIQTNYTIRYGANEYAYAMLVAMGGYNVAEVCAIGAEGMIRPAIGGYVEKKTTRIENPRYAEATKKYEPPFEFRTTLDLYGGATDGTLTLMSIISTEGMLMAIPYTYSAITLHDGDYAIYNMFKIMPGAKLIVDQGAQLTVKNEKAGEKEYLAGLIVYEDTFVEDHGSCTTFVNSKQLWYPSQPNGKKEGGALIVNGTLILEGRFGGEITASAADAQIKVKSLQAHLTFSSQEAIYPNDELVITYEQNSCAAVNGGSILLEYGKIYRSYQKEDGSFGWK